VTGRFYKATDGSLPDAGGYFLHRQGVETAGCSAGEPDEGTPHQLVCITLYKRGAEEVVRRLAA
jgi:hypothetical protein